MAENKSELSPYQSKYGGGYISVTQWLAELMCERKAKKERIPLPQFFWQNPIWASHFRAQTKHAADLLKDYDIDVIMKVLGRKEVRYIYSLGFKKLLVPLLNEEQDKQGKSPSIEIQNIDVTTKPRATFGNKNNQLNKLRGLD